MRKTFQMSPRIPLHLHCLPVPCNALLEKAGKIPLLRSIEMRSVESDLPRLEYFPETPIFNIQFQIAIFKISKNTKSGWGRIGHRKICCCRFLPFQLSSPLSLLKAESFVKSPSYHIKLSSKERKISSFQYVFFK